MVSSINVMMSIAPLTGRYSTVESFVRAAYPAHGWAHQQFYQQLQRRRALTPQAFLTRILRSLFPRAALACNARSAAALLGPAGYPLEIDVYLPELKLGFEYQVCSMWAAARYSILSVGRASLLSFGVRGCYA